MIVFPAHQTNSLMELIVKTVVFNVFHALTNHKVIVQVVLETALWIRQIQKNALDVHLKLGL